MIQYVGKNIALHPGFDHNGVGLASTLNSKTYLIRLQERLCSFKSLGKRSPCAFANILLQISLLPSFLMILVGNMMDSRNKIILFPVKVSLH